MTSDILIIGGGVIGLTTALRLADEGASVTVIDRAEAGREASWAGAGMLPPGLPRRDCDDSNSGVTEYRLRTLSNLLWPALTERLRQQTGIDNGYRNCGALELAVDGEDFDERINDWTSDDISVERLNDRSELERHVPGLHPSMTDAAFLPEFCQIRNPRHLKALKAACRMSGVDLREYVPDITLKQTGRCVFAATANETLSADRICVTAGSWTPALLRPLGVVFPIRPVRGQMVQLRLPQLPFRCVIEQGRRYLVPRPDGLILVGSTEEDAGFEKQTTSEGIRGLLEFASSIVPELRDAELIRQWAGLRPGSPDGLPFLGRIEGFDNLFIGAGHFRNGLQMSPGTAAMLAGMLLNETSETVEHEQRNGRT